MIFVSKRISGILTTATALGFLVGCGAFQTKNEGEKAKENAIDLAATWGGTCSKLDWLGFAYEKTELKFSAIGDFEKSTTLFGDENCGSAVGSLDESGTYAALGSSAAIAGARDLNLTVTSATVTPATADGADKLNKGSYCGITNWAAGQKTDILDKECLGMNHPKGEVVFDVYRVDQNGKRLETGKGSLFLDKSDAGSRPTKLDDQNPYTKN